MPHEKNVVAVDPADPKSVERALNTEWLLTNGLGGYAMGTLLGANTRRYHGLLVAATTPPVGRVIALHSMIEQIEINGATHDLSSHQFGDQLTLHPQGWRHLRQIICEPNCRIEWRHQIDSMRISKILSVLAGRNGIALHYSIQGAPAGARLRMRPLLTMRDFHAISRLSADIGAVEVDREGLIRIRIGDQQLHCFGNVRAWNGDPQWWRNFAYQLDRDRGQDWMEDQWSPGFFECEVRGGGETCISFAIALDSAIPARIPPIELIESPRCDPTVDRLRAAAGQFIVQRKAGDRWTTSVIAGYPWFGDWGRDTMIALPGLLLCTARIDEARSTLLTFSRNLRNGLIPNLFDDYCGAAHYNTVDASLWFVHAAHELWKAECRLPLPLGGGRSKGAPDSAGASATVLTPCPVPHGSGEILNACRQIIAAYRNGAEFNIRMDEDGLIAAGDEHSQLTWMDAKRDGVVFTPRHGKAVEINALWCNALRCLAEMTDNEHERNDLNALGRKAAESFRAKFWWNHRQCLYDVIGKEQIRPNQIFAVSLPFSPLDKDQQRAVVKITGDRLLTPFGLRTLDPDDPDYRGRYEGNLFERDRAYHNGTVWPWLIGPYCEALLRANDFNAASKRKVKSIIQPLIDEMRNTEGGRCIWQIAEVYDGDPPHRPAGCPAQAWSVAEVRRIAHLVEKH
jgi:glycogen debranching enzyme